MERVRLDQSQRAGLIQTIGGRLPARRGVRAATLALRGVRLLRAPFALGACRVESAAAVPGRGALEVRVRASLARAGRALRPPRVEAAGAATRGGPRAVAARA